MALKGVTETVFNSRDNRNDLELREDGVIKNIVNTTRVVLDLDGSQIADSDVTPGIFDWTSEGVNGRLFMKLGGQGFTPGDYTPRLVLYDATNVNGIVWSDPQTETPLLLKVVA